MNNRIIKFFIKIPKLVIYLFVNVFAWFFSYFNSRYIRQYRCIIYTIWLKNFLGKVGERTLIKYPFRSSSYPFCLYIGNNTIIREYCMIEPICKYRQQTFDSIISLGDNCDIGAFNHITSAGKVIIGNGVLTGRRVLISNNNHGEFSEDDLRLPPVSRNIIAKGDIIIEDNVWIGEGASILGSLHIGQGSVIGANSIVTKDVPPYTLVVGNPAKIIKRINLDLNSKSL